MQEGQEGIVAELLTSYRLKCGYVRTRRVALQRKACAIDQKIQTLIKRKASLERRIENIQLPFWFDEICPPLTRVLSRCVKKEIQALGPSGLGSTVCFEHADEALADKFCSFAIRVRDLEKGEVGLVTTNTRTVPIRPGVSVP